ncbi:MAG: MFS transporter [Bacteroidetes bacterium]|nr:MAG: MFS transporter [Bacteroidota bacterium]
MRVRPTFAPHQNHPTVLLPKPIRRYVDTFRGLPRTVWKLALVMLINRSGTMVLPFLTVYLTHELGYTLAQAGWVMTCFGIGSLGGAWLGGKLTDRIGPWTVQLGSLSLTGFLYLSLMWVTDLWAISALVMATSLVADTFRPANLTAISLYTSAENRTRSLSLIRLAVNLGFSAGPAAGGFIAAHFGYEWLFVVNALTYMVSAVFFVLALPRDDDAARSVAAPEDSDGPVLRKASVWADRQFVWFIFFLLLNLVAFLQLLSTVPVYLRSVLHYSEDTIGLVMAGNGLLIVLLEMPLIYWLEQRFPAMGLMVGGAILIGLAYVGFLLPLWHVLAVVWWVVLISVGEIINFPFSNTLAMERAPAHMRGQYMGLYTMMFSVSFILAPLAGTWIADHFGFGALWWTALLLSLASAAGLYRMWRSGRFPARAGV